MLIFYQAKLHLGGDDEDYQYTCPEPVVSNEWTRQWPMMLWAYLLPVFSPFPFHKEVH